MDVRELGRTTMRVPAVGMGTWRSFDVQTGPDKAVRRDIIANALAAGANLFDTSPMYGESEQVLAESLGGRRGEALVATKVWSQDLEEGRRQIDRALRWYGGVVDIYQVHNLVRWREYLPMLADLKAAGQVKVVGITHYRHDAFAEMADVMRSGAVDQIQIPYNAVNRAVEHEILPLAQELKIGVLVMEPLGSGALLRKPPTATALLPLASAGIRTWAQALLKYILSDERVHCVIPATSHPERMTENALSGSPPWLDEDQRRYVERLAKH